MTLQFDIWYDNDFIGNCHASSIESKLRDLYSEMREEYELDTKYEAVQDWILDCEFTPTFE